MHAYIYGLNERQLQTTLSYRGLSGNEYTNYLWQLLIQLVNHGTQHRAELATRLTELDQSPGDLDFVIYLSSIA